MQSFEVSCRSGLSTFAHVKAVTHGRRLTCGALEAGVSGQRCGPCRGMQRAIRLVTLSEVSCRLLSLEVLAWRQLRKGAADLWCPGDRCFLSALCPLHKWVHRVVWRLEHNVPTQLIIVSQLHLRSSELSETSSCACHQCTHCVPTENMSAKHLDHERDLACNNNSFPV